MSYTITDLRRDFPDDDACLEFLFRKKYPQKKAYRIRGRKSFADKAGNHFYPLKGTIFERSTTPLTKWFHAMFIFGCAKNGVSASELQRHLGVTYKCAFRMCRKIRSLMKQSNYKLSGTFEIDEAFIGGRTTRKNQYQGKSTLVGIVQRDGSVRVKVMDRQDHLILGHIQKNVKPGSKIASDSWKTYKKVSNLGYDHRMVNHSKGEYRRGWAHTSTVESFWGQLKKSLHGTWHAVSPEQLQSYVDFVAFCRDQKEPFQTLLQRI